MREILFRGEQIENYEWAEGFLVKKPSTVHIGNYSPWYIYVPPKDPDDIYSMYNIIPETVGQYTGLTDKNGMKIFEHDICRVCLDPEICIAHIQYDERTASFNMRYNDYQCNTFLDMRLAENRVGDRVWIEVIGNIHDNPELLEV